MYRWNSRVPTVRWKDTCISDRETTGISAATEDIIIKSDSKKANICSKTSTTSDSCKGSAGNLSGSTLTSSANKPVTLLQPGGAALSLDATNSPSADRSWRKNPPCNFDTRGTSFSNNTPTPLSTSTSAACSGEARRSHSTARPHSPSDELDLDEGRSWNWNVIRTFFSLFGIVVREIRTLAIALLVRLLVNPINYWVCCFSPRLSSSFGSSWIASVFSSIWRIVPGGSSTSYYCCKRRNIISSGTACANSASFPFHRLPCCCTCNCISFLRPIFGWCSRSTAFYSQGTRCCGSGCSATTNSSGRVAPGVGKPRRLGKMAHILSKTMTLLGVAFVIHFIIMSTFAEKEGFHPQPRYSSDEFSNKHHYHHHYNHDELDMDLGAGRRLARSYRHDKHPSSDPDPNLLTPTHSRQLTNKSEAVFSTENSTVIIAQIGSKTYLPCAVRNLGSGVASWIRRRDYHLLTVGMGTYSNDDRFMVSHNRPAQSWELHIKYVKTSDEGNYECQISTHPPSSIFVHLRVVEAKAEILGEPDKHVRSGSTFELVCVLRDSTEPPVYVFWYHNDRMINYDNVRGVQVSSDAEKSILTIQEAQKSDSGNYTCVPSNARPTSISVHILNGEKPAAMQHGSRSHSPRLVPVCSSSLLFVTALAVFVLTTWLATTNLNQHTCLLYFHHHQYKEESTKNKKKESEGEHGHIANRTPPQRKPENGKDRKKKTHQQNNHHQLYLQLLRKLSEGFANEWRHRHDGNPSAADNKASVVIPSEPSRVAISSALYLLFLVEVNRRAVDYSCKSNPKKLQVQCCHNGFPSSSSQITCTSSPISPAGIRHRQPSIITKERYSPLNATYEYCYSRQVVTDGKGNEGEMSMASKGGRIIIGDDIPKLNHHRKQSLTHLSLVAPAASEEDKVMTLMEQWSPIQSQKGHGTTNAKLEIKGLPVDDITLKTGIIREYSPHPTNNLLELRHPQGEKWKGSNLEKVEPLSTPLAVVINPGGLAPGVRSEPVAGSESGMNMVTILSPAESSLPHCSSTFSTLPPPHPTFPQAAERFISGLNNPTQSLLNYNLKVEGLEKPLEKPMLVMRDSIVIPVQVIIIVIIREEVDFSHQQRRHHHHHHHLCIISPSAPCSYPNSLTENGLLLSSFPLLFLTSSVVAAPSRIITGSRMNKTSVQPSSFCLRRETEEETCLPHRHLAERLVEYYSDTVPTAAKAPSQSCRTGRDDTRIPSTFDLSHHHRTTQVVVR